MDITRFSNQHEEILKLANDLAKHLNIDSLKQDASPARIVLSGLAGKLKVHLAMEDKSLYPQFMQSGDENTQRTAEEFQSEMGGLAQAFNSYVSAWPSSLAIQENSVPFIEQTKQIYEVLTKRIEREESTLYPLAEAL